MSDDNIQRYEKMLLDDPQSRAFAPLAEAHRKAGRLDDAINVAKVGLELHPGYSGGLVVLGRALYEKGELDNAIEVLQEAVRDTPESYLGQKFLGKVLMGKGENKGALRALEAANLLSPEDEEVVRLLDEVRSKAVTPSTMEYDENAVDSAQKAQIVTYEQKPTTVDGVELSPLPGGEIEETFTFSGGGTADPADLTPVDVEVEIIGDEVTVVDIAEEEMTATVIEDKEVEQATGMESLDELGAEAAAFIREGESFVEESMEGLPGEALADEAFFSVEEELEVVVEPEENFTPPVDPPVAAEPEPEPAPVPVFTPQPDPVPEPVFVPAPIPVPPPVPVLTSASEAVSEPVFVSVPEPEHAPEPAFAPDTTPQPETEPQEAVPAPLGPSSGDDQFSTETLADLYSQQGLIEKAATIYRQILDQTPANEVVKLKLDTLQEQSPTDTVSVQEVQPREESPTESLHKGGNEDTLSVLEGLLENAERMKRP
jgi:tetratricopeptide (TPR) repeat protein